jgi:hypothetical protein
MAGTSEWEATLDAAARDLDAVEAALRRLDDGSFGRCQVCGAALDSARQRAEPLEARCPAHRAEPLEARGPAQGAEPLEARGPAQGAEPLEARGPAQGAEPLEARGPAQGAEPTVTDGPTVEEDRAGRGSERTVAVLAGDEPLPLGGEEP